MAKRRYEVENNMKNRIPPELSEALSPGVGYSLLLKGEPGTGKTMLALEILTEFGGENAVYLSTRVSHPTLYEKLGVAEAEKPATLVIDSWEAITAEEEKEKIKELEAAITNLVRNYATEYKMNLILVLERTDTTMLDYLVDGIVEMARIDIDYRRARELVVKKLRGTRIDQHKYGFTLDGGRFRFFPPFERRKVEKQRRVEVVPNTTTHLSTGCEELDKIVGGGLSKGSTAMIEYGDDLSLLGYQSIVAHMIINSIQQRNHCVVIPSSGWDERRLRRGILPFVKEKDYLKYLTVFEIRREMREGRENVEVLEGLSMDEDLPIFSDFISKLKPPVMVIIGTDLLEFQYRLKTLGNLEKTLELFAY